MKAVMKSVSPRICEKVANGDCTILVSKTAPKCGAPFNGYIYCTFPKKPAYTLWLNRGTENKFLADGKVIGEFVCDKIDEYTSNERGWYCYDLETCLLCDEIAGYGKGKTLYGWHISDLKIYDKPKEFSEFYTIDESGSDCCIACVYHETPLEEMPCRTCTGERRYLYRPPQSWCYVEEI